MRAGIEEAIMKLIADPRTKEVAVRAAKTFAQAALSVLVLAELDYVQADVLAAAAFAGAAATVSFLWNTLVGIEVTGSRAADVVARVVKTFAQGMLGAMAMAGTDMFHADVVKQAAVAGGAAVISLAWNALGGHEQPDAEE